MILANPPFKGSLDRDAVDVSILRGLRMGGRAAVIVPDGVLFGSSRQHIYSRLQNSDTVPFF